MSFLFQSLLAVGLPLIALPLLIHLINLRRHRRIQWAAMDFLLESQKRNKKWIVLKQLLLLLMRTAAVALVVFMLAGPVVRSGWAGLFGRGVTHHLILLDDSYSMADRWDETSALEEGKRALTQILRQARTRSDSQVVTLLRFSEASKLAAGAGPEIDRRVLDADFISELEKVLGNMAPSETAAGPADALRAATRLPEPAADEACVAYLISDFRRPQWDQQSQLKDLVGQLSERAGKLLFVQTAYEDRPNLAITRLAPAAGIRAAGVETWMELSVANYGDAPATALTVAIEQDGARLPAVDIDEVPPGETVNRRFRVTFPQAGANQVKAAIESDAVESDNARYFAAQIPPLFPVLIIDGSSGGDDGYFMRTALSPGGRNLAGWSPRVEPPSFLRQHESLNEYAAILLLDVPRLEDAETEALEAYVRSGGGVAIFPGPGAQRPFYNEKLYRDGAGLLPAPLATPSQLLRQSGEGTADVEVSDHPLFSVFTGQRNSFLALVRVNFYYALDPLWSLPKSGDVRILARLRNGAPFVVEKSLGAGRVVTQLGKLSPQQTDQGVWSTWSINPAFPVYANELVGYLSAARRRYDARTVEEPVRITLPEAGYLPDVRVTAPGAGEREATARAPAAKEGNYVVTAPGKPRSGVWRFQVTTSDGKPETRYVAVNVPVGEGDLHRIDQAELAERLRGIDYGYALASEFTEVDDQLAGFRMSDALLYALIGVLIAEQLFAVAASYHPAPTPRAA